MTCNAVQRRVLVWVACCALSPFAHAVELFGPGRVDFTVFFARDLVVADFDGDAVLDLAVVGESSCSVSILLGDGHGGFSSASDVDVGDRPGSVAAGDFDGDSVTDLVVANRGSSSLSILLGDGQGGFSAGLEIGVGIDPSSVAVGDFSGDGAADLAVTNAGPIGALAPDTVSILLGDGQGGFSSTVEIDVGDRAEFIAAGDFNGDGATDLAVANAGQFDDPTPDTVGILLGDGHGGFSSMSEIGVGDRPESIGVGDFNRDGALDLVVTNAGGLNDPALDTVSILLGDGQGGFSSAVEIDVGDRPEFVAVGDLSGDGFADLAVVNRASNSVSIRLGDGLGGFSATSEVGVGNGPTFVAQGEFNGDGATDLAVTNGGRSVSILLGDGLGGFSSTPQVGVGDGPQSVAVGDFNGDGAADVATANRRSDSVSILLGDGQGGFAAAPDVVVGREPTSIAIGEFNGDGASDLAVTQSGSDSVRILLGDGLGGFSPSDEIGLPRFPISIGVGEFNADGAVDLAIANYDSGSVSILLGNGLGEFSYAGTIPVGNATNSVAVGDFNSDSVADLAFANRESDSVSILLGDGLGGFSPILEPEVGIYPSSVAVGDFNGDGNADLTVVYLRRLGAPGGTVSILLGDGLGGFSSTPEIGVGVLPSSAVIGDFNADDVADVAVTNGNSSSVSILLGDGRGGISADSEFGVAPGPNSVAMGEFNGDGAVDLVVANFGGDTVSILFNQLSDRADLNGSNRIDGFDVAAIGRLAGRGSGEPGYRRGFDVDLNGTIDGNDLALVASRFGELRKEVSPLRAVLENPLEPDPSTITLQQIASEGDLLTVAVLVNDENDPVAAADFAVTFEPTDEQSGERLGQVLEVAGFEPGSYLSGGVGQAYTVNTDTPGRVQVAVSRLPADDQAGSGEQSLINLSFRARREGDAELEFAPFRRDQPTLLDAANREVSAVSFVGGVDVSVEAEEGEETPGQKIGFAPELLDFGQVGVGATSPRTLRISNFGFSELTVVDVSSTLPAEFASFFTSSFTVPPFGFVELTVEFSPERVGLFSGDLVIESDDPQQPDTDGDGFGEIRAPLLGSSGIELAVAPTRVDFGRVAVGNDAIRTVRFTNRGSSPLTLTSFRSSDARFVPQAGFSVLDPGETGIIDISFLPDVEGELRAVLTVGLDAPAEKTVVVNLVGVGETDDRSVAN